MTIFLKLIIRTFGNVRLTRIMTNEIVKFVQIETDMVIGVGIFFLPHVGG